VTQLRKMMLEELQRRNFSQTTVNSYIRVVKDFARHFHRPPDELGKEHIRSYQVYLLKERKLGVRTVRLHTSALRFFFCKTLKRSYPVERSSLSESAAATADHSDPRRSDPADRFGK
jgi:integrase/recombinase XerD